VTPPRGRARSAGGDYGGDRRRRKRRKDRRRRRKRSVLLLLLLAVAVIVVVASVGLGAGAALSSSCSLSSLRPVEIGQNSFVYAADGSLLGTIPAVKNRQPISLAQMGPWLPKATVAIEDRRFWEHGGVDYEGILRAAWRDLSAGKVVEGGSTITQQLARNLYIGHSERTFQRKLTEACLAVKLSRNRSKTWILENYMNQVPYGNQAYGIEAAARTYFSRSAGKLNLRQAALLAGLPQAPSAYDPLRSPEKALARRNEVLKAMLDNGDINRKQYDWAVSSDNLELKPGTLYRTLRQPDFFRYVIDELQEQYGTNTVRTGGLKVYTTIDPKLQEDAKRSIAERITEKTDPASALVAIDPRNGAIRAMVGVTPGNTDNQYNLVSQGRRQPGSTFKTFVLAAAIEQGINPDTTYYTSAPFTCSTGPWCAAQPWHVTTYGHTYLGSTSITRATLASDNTVYAQLTLDVGPEKVRDMATRLGIDFGGQPTVAAIGIGGLRDGVSPLDMASAYATIAAGGIYSKPMAITKVVLPDGKSDDEAGWGKPQRKRVVADWVAAKVTDVLSQNIRYGTGYPNATLYDRPAAGKTGTTEDWVDAWFCGFTPSLSTTVWLGYPKARVPMTNVHGIAVTGGSFPAQIWHGFMTAALDHTPPLEFPEAKTEPHWRSDYTRGHYELGYVPSYTPTTDETSTTTSTAETATAATSTAATSSPAKTTTTAAQPATTAAATTSAAPPPPTSTAAVTPPPPETTSTTAAPPATTTAQ
jgi:penicillin-binding protein 1A